MASGVIGIARGMGVGCRHRRGAQHRTGKHSCQDQVQPGPLPMVGCHAGTIMDEF